MESDLFPYSCLTCIPAKEVLVLAPHPDDEVFGCGGAIAGHVEAKTSVTVVILTDGALFGDAALRAKESIAAAQVLGYGHPEFWGIQDRELRYAEELVQRIADKIVISGVDLVYAPSPWEIHPDHRQASWLAVEAVRRVTQPVRLAFYEVGVPLRPNMLFDISPFLDAKEAAMRCFGSQLDHQDYLRHIRALNQFRTYTLSRDVLAAEAFWLLDSSELDQLTGAGLLMSVSPGVLPKPSETPVALPLVSILIRSTDRKFLADALDSVMLQTYPHIEIVVIGARPNHRPLPSKCGAFPLRLVQTDTPLPRSQAANIAMAEAHGEFFLFLDDDDWLMPGHIARLVRVLIHQPHALAAYTGIAKVDETGHPLGQSFDLPFDATRLMTGNLMPIHAVLFSAKVLDQGCRFDETIDHYEDWDFWLQLAKLAPMVHLPGVSGVYRIHTSSGVHANAGPGDEATSLIYQKWDADWTPQKIGSMMQRAWLYPELSSSITDLETRLLLAIDQAEDAKRNAENAQRDAVDARLAATEARQDAADAKQDQAHSQMLASENALLLELQLQRVMQLEGTIAEMQGSQSWRMTQPWRWLSGRLRLRYWYQKIRRY